MGSIPIPGKFPFFFLLIPLYIDMPDDVINTERAPWQTDIYLQRLGRWQLYNE